MVERTNGYMVLPAGRQFGDISWLFRAFPQILASGIHNDDEHYNILALLFLITSSINCFIERPRIKLVDHVFYKESL